MDEVMGDKRFAHIAKDPKFRRIPKSERKVKIDKRFRSMFEDKKFTVKYTIDKRGRPLNQTSTENLRKYYDLSSSEEDKDKAEGEAAPEKSSEGRKKKKKKKKIKSQKSVVDKLPKSKGKNDASGANSGGDSETSSSDVEDDNIEDAELRDNEKQLFSAEASEKKQIARDVKKKLHDLTVDYARGEGVLLTDSSSEEDSTENEDDDEEEIEHDWGELDKEAETTDDATHRLAICNMDWDRIRAVDLLVLFNSFLPPGGLIKSVTIYPSEFGLQRMKEEEVKGPIELVDSDKRQKEIESDDENEEGSEYHMEKMRQYQLNRLKYYYAVMDCDSVETANKIYTECDGIEYESTSTKLDLRFIPDDMEFEHEPKEVCDKLPNLSKYQPRQFTTTALQQVKVELTWDETNPERQEVTQKINSGKLDELNENDIQTYLASGSSDEESAEEEANPEEDDIEAEAAAKGKNPIDKYKLLLKTIEEQEESKKKQEVELEFTWGLGTRERSEKLVKERMNKPETLTPFEQYLEKRREKKKAKRDERKKSREQKETDDSADSSSDDSLPSDVDINDPYFAEEMKNLKPKDKKKKKKNDRNEINSSDKEDEDRRKAELELLMLDNDDEEGKRHFNIKKIEEESFLSKSKKKRLQKKNKKNEKEVIEDEFEVDVADPRFAALYTSHHYNIDPADPRYRRTKGTEAFVVEKLKRRADKNIAEESPMKQPKRDGTMSADLTALVKSIKRNTKNISMPIK